MPKKLVPIGVIHGRFQGLHLGHMEYLLEGKSRCHFLFVGITHCDVDGLTLPVDHRNQAAANPFTYYERMLMIRLALREAGIPLSEFAVIPFPIEQPEKIKLYAPPEARYFLTIYDNWGRHKLALLRSLGLETEVMWERDNASRFTSGTEVRRCIAQGEAWHHLVPPAVYQYITENGLEQRIRRHYQAI